MKKKAQVIWLIGSECAPGKEKEFNKWYDEVHYPMALRTPGVVRGARYKRIEDDEQYPKFLSVTFIETEADIEKINSSETIKAATEDFLQHAAPEFGMQVRWLVHYRRIGP